MFTGDQHYSIECTGDVVKGDHIRFSKAVFLGSFKKPKFSHYQTITAQVIKESYGSQKQQHTFTLLTDNGETMLIKGRNLYRQGVWRKPWLDETQRQLIAKEKHQRGAQARTYKKIFKEY